MNEIIELLEDTENRLISEIRNRKIKESKELIKLWEHIIEVQTELAEV